MSSLLSSIAVTYRQIALGSRILSATGDGGAHDGGDWVMPLGAGQVSGRSLGHGEGRLADEAFGFLAAEDYILRALLDGRLDRVPLDLQRRRHGWCVQIDIYVRARNLTTIELAFCR